MLVNKFFYLRGGSERVMFDTARLLESRGHSVRFFSMAHPENLPHPDSVHFVPFVDLRAPSSLSQRLRTAGRILYYREARRRFARLLDESRPDLVHLHNIHHQISPSILPEIKKRGIPSAMTLHDYKLVCGTYRLERGGKVCEECAGGRYYRCLLRRCQDGSLAKSALTAAEMYLHHRLLRLWPMIDLFVSPSRFLKDKLAEMGFPGRIEVLPNFVVSEAFASDSVPQPDLFLYLGRLSPEKGLFTLLQAFQHLGARLRILGDGPIRGELERAAARLAPGRVSFLGHRPREEIARELAAAAAVVVPSEWYENNPISVLEAYAAGRPVIGARIGGIPELVREGETGLTFESGNAEELAGKISFLLAHPAQGEKMGRAGRATVEKIFDPESYYGRLLEIYESLLGKSRRRG